MGNSNFYNPTLNGLGLKPPLSLLAQGLAQFRSKPISPPGSEVQQPACRDFQNGRCTRSNCKFSHGSPLQQQRSITNWAAKLLAPPGVPSPLALLAPPLTL